MAESISSLESSPYSDIEFTSKCFKTFHGSDLSLDDFNDEDLSEITEEKEINQSFVNRSFKCHKVKLSPNEILEHIRNISSDMIQLDLFGDDVIYEESSDGSESKTSPKNVIRPHTLSLFSEPSLARSSNCKSKENFHKPSFNLHSSSNYFETNKRNRDCYEEVQGSNVPSTDDETNNSFLTRSASEWSIEDPDDIEYCYIDGEMKRQTHTAQFKFIPRHNDEMELDINDPVHILQQHDDYWCDGINMRTGDRGICPSYYVQRVEDEYDEILDLGKESADKFFLYFLGSLEVPCHKGNDVLCQAMHKVAEARRLTLHSNPPAYVCLMVSSGGVKMIDQSDLKKQKAKKNNYKKQSFSSSFKVKQQTHFFQMKNVSFCGHHPTNSKYFGFITRHPTQSRFACHTFVSEKSTQDVSESMGIAFSKFYQDYLEYTHPTEDFYME